MSGPMILASPKTPSARKTPTVMTPSKSRPSQAASGSKNKRKIKAEATPSEHATPSKSKGKTKSLATQVVPAQNAKKQKVHHEEMSRRTSTVLPSIENHPLPFVENHPPTPYDTPSPQELFEERQDQQQRHQHHQHHQPHQPHHLATSQNSEGIQVSANGNTQATSNAHGYGIFHQVVRAAFQKNPQMLPTDPTEIINSNLIDRFTHALWGMICFGNIPLHEQAAKYGAMMGEPMIRALALLNILPSWWFLRERVLEWLRGSTPRIIDDSEMAQQVRGVMGMATTIVKRGAQARQMAMQSSGGGEAQSMAVDPGQFGGGSNGGP